MNSAYVVEYGNDLEAYASQRINHVGVGVSPETRFDEKR